MEPLDRLKGTIRRFGSAGPVYMVVGVGEEAPDCDRMLDIVVLESGQKAQYRLQDLLDDPEA